MLFDWLVVGQIVPTNPASAVRGPKHSLKKGKTPALTAEEARDLLDSIATRSPVGLRDRALIALMIYNLRARARAWVRCSRCAYSARYCGSIYADQLNSNPAAGPRGDILQQGHHGAGTGAAVAGGKRSRRRYTRGGGVGGNAWQGSKARKASRS